ncbi:protein of unknown function [Candidatus Filomicrobium marinum]|uniref:Uncharacterized protein n=1 Tax=Candidatus Filomicrobium marinum TaxID=1608628 RepID=A0A0D6JJK6_9HYPH|nr:protein of unknown function [Candidatus Filomicrobium marinum]
MAARARAMPPSGGKRVSRTARNVRRWLPCSGPQAKDRRCRGSARKTTGPGRDGVGPPSRSRGNVQGHENRSTLARPSPASELRHFLVDGVDAAADFLHGYGDIANVGLMGELVQVVADTGQLVDQFIGDAVRMRQPHGNPLQVRLQNRSGQPGYLDAAFRGDAVHLAMVVFTQSRLQESWFDHLFFLVGAF